MHRAASLLITLLLLAGLAASGSATPKKALFDYTKNETAGQADWIIDTHMPTPSPAQSGITPGTPESYWLGGISAWGVTMVKRGYTVATLTSSYGITYGNSSNPYDLSNYDVFIIPEPQNPFSAAETTAIYAFLRNGGGIVAVGDHNSSDRDSDGWDSPRIYNALDPNHVLGVHWQVTGEGNNNVSQVSTNVATSPGDSLIYGPAGTVANLSFHNGDTMVLYPGTNPSVRGEVWMNGVSQSSTSQVMAASAVYGNGRIVFVCDSSPMDDGSGQSGNSLYTGWTEAGTTDSTVFMNAALWVTRRDAAGDTTDPVVTVTSPNGGETWAAGSSHNITWTATDNVGVTTVDLAYSLNGGSSWTNIATGQANSGTYAWPVPQSPSTQALVRVKAYDAALNMGSDVSNAVFTIADQTAPTVAVTSPNGGESWAAGSSHNITWIATDNVGVT
ncbi:MAG TPA: Ig-like domain-containing protein, partial [Candidatus Saccharimonadales bacterium]|nr:Ig-like domain-containing protein [Candidatus Saccharimonadales bacterium]